MANEEKNSLSKVIFKLLMMVPSLLKFSAKMISIIEIETSIAKKSLLTIAVLYLIIGCLFLSCWWCLLGILIFYLVTLTFSYTLVFFIMFILNTLLLIIAILAILKTKDKLLFLETRNLLSHFRDS